jgi:hypothetical protein
MMRDILIEEIGLAIRMLTAMLGATIGALLVLKVAPAASLVLAAAILGLVFVASHHATMHVRTRPPSG